MSYNPNTKSNIEGNNRSKRKKKDVYKWQEIGIPVKVKRIPIAMITDVSASCWKSRLNYLPDVNRLNKPWCPPIPWFKRAKCVMNNTKILLIHHPLHTIMIGDKKNSTIKKEHYILELLVIIPSQNDISMVPL